MLMVKQNKWQERKWCCLWDVHILSSVMGSLGEYWVLFCFMSQIQRIIGELLKGCVR